MGWGSWQHASNNCLAFTGGDRIKLVSFSKSPFSPNAGLETRGRIVKSVTHGRDIVANLSGQHPSACAFDQVLDLFALDDRQTLPFFPLSLLPCSNCLSFCLLTGLDLICSLALKPVPMQGFSGHRHSYDDLRDLILQGPL